MAEGNDQIGLQRAVLVIGADSEISELVSNLASIAKWKIEQVPSNEAALEIVQQRPFGVVVTGSKTSGAMDLDLLRRIRRIHRHTRMIILTDQSTPSDVIAAIRANAFSFFTLPFPLYQLKEMLESAIAAPPWDDGIELLSATPSWIHLFARCDLTTAGRLVQFLNEIGDALPAEERANVSFAFREMLVNAIEHGGHFDPREYVEISYLRSRRAISCRIKDPGRGFSFDEIPHAAVSNPPEDPIQHLEHRTDQNLRPGGFGILLASKLVDELIYSETGNEVVLIKYLDPTRNSLSNSTPEAN
jgi:anti-sigma regulatory factor (Ser/Thr protein kinase)/CheY-like chemotaxis protein